MRYTGQSDVKNLLHWQRKEDSHLPNIKIGDEVPIEKVELRSGKTAPPPYLSESELISLMEKNGIGTDASIPTHINNVCERRYCKLDPGRHMVPTDLGIVLAQGYMRIDPELVLPEVRARIERDINEIAEGRATKEQV